MPIDDLSQPVATPGGRDAARWAQLGIVTRGDLLRHYPRRYLKLGELTFIAELPLGEPVSVLGQVITSKLVPMRDKKRRMLKLTLSDGTDTLDVTFFNAQEWLAKKFAPGGRALLSGTVELFRGERQLAHPKIIPVKFNDPEDAEKALNSLDDLVPIYPATASLPSGDVAKAVDVVLKTLGEVEEPLPVEVRARHGLMSLREALVLIHQPKEDSDWRAAKHRLLFEEAFILQAALARRRWTNSALLAVPRLARPDGLLEAFDARLPFELTAGQRRVGEEIASDLAAIHPMHRLLQGEVGSGKTVVALRAMLAVVDSGGQAALLAPTEVLATQHYRSITAMLGDLAARGQLGGDERGTRVVLLTGSTPTPVRRQGLLDLACGDAGIVVGTHALLSETVAFFDLGLVVVDEQHRFGVEQRDALRGKGRTAPHVLVMTATPIPRTVAMTVFGDLEISTLEELPAGRAEITTHVVPVAEHPAWLDRTWERLREEVAAGRQCYVVCPRIDPEPDLTGAPTPPAPVVWRPPVVESKARKGAGEGEAEDVARVPLVALLDVVETVKAQPSLTDLRIGSLHGRMTPEARESVMRGFADGEVDILVATTVVEVGLDVPNASTMVIIDADRYGVSQLHQLRGRVGRGEHAGLCLLVTKAEPGTPARTRLDAVARTVDGFELARVDLELRREGDVLGATQSGTRSSLRLLRVLQHEDLIVTARHEANAVIAADPDLRGNPALAVAIQQLMDAEQEAYLDRS